MAAICYLSFVQNQARWINQHAKVMFSPQDVGTGTEVAVVKVVSLVMIPKEKTLFQLGDMTHPSEL